MRKESKKDKIAESYWRYLSNLKIRIIYDVIEIIEITSAIAYECQKLMLETLIQIVTRDGGRNIDWELRL